MENDKEEVEIINISSLFDEITLKIFSFLNVFELLTVSEVCFNWNEFAKDDFLWIELCRERWIGKQNKELTKEREHILREKKKSFKEIYKFEEEDRFRTKITIEELCNLKWQFTFIYGGRSMIIDFKPNFTIHFSERLIVDQREMRFRFIDEDLNGFMSDPKDSNCGSFIQVESYPFLTVSRNEANWGWQLNNRYVVFFSKMDNEPLNVTTTHFPIYNDDDDFSEEEYEVEEQPDVDYEELEEEGQFPVDSDSDVDVDYHPIYPEEEE